MEQGKGRRPRTEFSHICDRDVSSKFPRRHVVFYWAQQHKNPSLHHTDHLRVYVRTFTLITRYHFNNPQALLRTKEDAKCSRENLQRVSGGAQRSFQVYPQCVSLSFHNEIREVQKNYKQMCS